MVRNVAFDAEVGLADPFGTPPERNGQVPHEPGRRNGHRAGDHEGCPMHRRLLNLLHAAVDRGASDVHLVVDYPPVFRVHGELTPAQEEPLTPETARKMIESVLPDGAAERFGKVSHLDCSVVFQHAGRVCRFRANCYVSQGHLCACLRHIANEIPTFDWLGFPQAVAERMGSFHSGLVIVTGATGSGKSSTLAALMSLLRTQRRNHFLTIEEPIEYVYPPADGSLVTQREVGRDVPSFAEGLRSGLRQDPDVVLVGEIRDRDTARTAISAAETGHLILTTMHTRDAKGALTRLVDLFPHEAQDDMRKQLLPPANAGQRRVLAIEFLACNQQVQAAIRAGKIEQIESAIQTGKRDGMLSLDDDLQRLVSSGKISTDTARRFAKDAAGISGGSKAW
jgi:twitching motility protein PilT